MKTDTINKIEAIKDSVAVSLEAYRARQLASGTDMDLGQFGSEKEYSIRGLIGGVKNILTDVSYLVKAHNIFIKLSTHTERNNLYTNLNSLNTYLQNPQYYSSIAGIIDTIKVSLRVYNLPGDKGRYLEFSDEVDNTRRIALSLEGVITETKDNLTTAESVYQEIVKTNDKYSEAYKQLEEEKDSLSQAVNDFTSEFSDFKILATSAKTNETLIAEKLDTVKESEIAFDEFMAKIDAREAQLTAQSKSTTEYKEKLKSYADEHVAKLNHAKELIDKAKIALEYTTAQGMSAAFQTKHDHANNPKEQRAWLIAAGAFILVTIGLGVWIVGGWGINSGDRITSLVGRISMIPFTLYGALFCANQYTKKRNIAEDYAYKTVLSKSIVAFSEELRSKDPERYAEYISTVLREIHQDPLRKRVRDKDEVSIQGGIGLVGEITKLFKEMKQ